MMHKYCLALLMAVIASSGPAWAQYRLGAPIALAAPESSVPTLQGPAHAMQTPAASSSNSTDILPCGCGPFGACAFHRSPSYPEPLTYGTQCSFWPTPAFTTYPEPIGNACVFPWYCQALQAPPAYQEPLGNALGWSPPHPVNNATAPGMRSSTGCVVENKPRCWPFFRHCWTRISPVLSAPVPSTGEPAVGSELMPTRHDVARMLTDGGYSQAEITAAKIKLDEAQAKGRQAAVKYLANIDCHYYPEAETGLIAALRAERIETVRFEAAQAIGTCRCMTPRMIEALRMTAMGLDTDGNPSESSDRVRQAARDALNRCPQCQGVPLPADPGGPMPQWMPPGPMSVQPTGFWHPAFLPYVQPATQEEREIAATVSTLRTSPAADARPLRSVVQWISDLAAGRTMRMPSGTATPAVDRRLQGLRPLGSELLIATPVGAQATYNR